MGRRDIEPLVETSTSSISNKVRRSQGIILLYDITNRKSLDSLKNMWMADVEAYKRHYLAVLT